MLSQIDAALLVGLEKQAWPDPAAHPLPSPLLARTSAMKLIASSLFALLLSAMIALMLRDNALSDQAYEGWRLWLRIAAAVGMAGLGVGLVVAGVRAVVDPKPLVMLDAEGLRVPGLYRELVPWSEIAVVVHDKPRVKIFGPGRIVMGVRGGERFVRVESTELRPAENARGLDAVQLPQMLDVPVERLLAALQGHRAHFGRDATTMQPD